MKITKAQRAALKLERAMNVAINDVWQASSTEYYEAAARVKPLISAWVDAREECIAELLEK